MSVAAPPTNKVTNFINGQWAPAQASEWRDVVNPATGEILASVPLAGAADEGERFALHGLDTALQRGGQPWRTRRGGVVLQPCDSDLDPASERNFGLGEPTLQRRSSNKNARRDP